MDSPTIFENQNGAKFKYTSCGKNHLAAITTDGRLMTLGNPDNGKLGHKKYQEVLDEQVQVKG